MKKAISLLVVLALTAMLCMASVSAAGEAITVTVDPATQSPQVGQTVTFYVSVAGLAGIDGIITWDKAALQYKAPANPDDAILKGTGVFNAEAGHLALGNASAMNTKVFQMDFTALKAGATTVKINCSAAVDGSSPNPLPVTSLQNVDFSATVTVTEGGVETSVPPVETSVPPVETSVPPVQTSVPPVQTSVPPVETSVASVSSGTTDSTVSTASTDSTVSTTSTVSTASTVSTTSTASTSGTSSTTESAPITGDAGVVAFAALALIAGAATVVIAKRASK